MTIAAVSPSRSSQTPSLVVLFWLWGERTLTRLRSLAQKEIAAELRFPGRFTVRCGQHTPSDAEQTVTKVLWPLGAAGVRSAVILAVQLISVPGMRVGVHSPRCPAHGRREDQRTNTCGLGQLSSGLSRAVHHESSSFSLNPQS